MTAIKRNDGREQALKDPSILKTYRRIAYVPFDPVAKRTEATIADGTGKEFKVSKGMPPVIFKLCDIDGGDLVKAQKIVSDYAAEGYRALAVARTDASGKWVMLGILPMFDPPRLDSKETIARAKTYGVKVKMVTGDDVAIAKTIARDLGLGSNIVAASDIFTGEVGHGDVPMDLAAFVACYMERRIETFSPRPGGVRRHTTHAWCIGNRTFCAPSRRKDREGVASKRIVWSVAVNKTPGELARTKGPAYKPSLTQS
jgi:hypothetical protein